ncbi:hypothetical protein MPER_01242 [Moniliophthora perniciosa FA553]|nr:hypothetical protein MPER_01242 [Moniliophthora perniciosa FA553]
MTAAIIPGLSKVIEGGALDVVLAFTYQESDRSNGRDRGQYRGRQSKIAGQVLAKSVVTCFERAIYETEKLLAKFTAAADTRSAPAFDPESVPSRQRFLTRRVKLLTNLLRWRKSTGERFGLGKLAARIVDGLVVEIADGGWEVGGADVVQTVAGMLPPDLVTNGIKTRLSSR